MANTIDSALDDPSVTVVNRDDHIGFYEIQIGDLETVVTIELGRLLDSDETKFTCSHAMKTPIQAGPYISSRPYWDDPAYALHQAINGLTSYYRQAVKAGHAPKEHWLVRRGG